MMYAGLAFHGQEFREESGLRFPDEDVRLRLQGVSLPTVEVVQGRGASTARTFTGAATFRVIHDGGVRVGLTVSPERAFVLVAQPD